MCVCELLVAVALSGVESVSRARRCIPWRMRRQQFRRNASERERRAHAGCVAFSRSLHIAAARGTASCSERGPIHLHAAGRWELRGADRDTRRGQCASSGRHACRTSRNSLPTSVPVLQAQARAPQGRLAQQSAPITPFYYLTLVWSAAVQLGTGATFTVKPPAGTVLSGVSYDVAFFDPYNADGNWITASAGTTLANDPVDPYLFSGLSSGTTTLGTSRTRSRSTRSARQHRRRRRAPSRILRRGGNCGRRRIGGELDRARCSVRANSPGWPISRRCRLAF